MVLKPKPVSKPKPAAERFSAATLVAAIRQAMFDLPDARMGATTSATRWAMRA